MTETELLDALLSKKSNLQELAFTELVAQYSEKLYYQIRRIVLRHEDASDVLQNTFIKAWENIDSFERKSKLSTWLFRIAINESITHINKEASKRCLSLDEKESWLIDSIEHDPYFDGDAAQLKFQKAILRLPEKQRVIFNLKYFSEMKYEEMSKILYTTVGGLKASFHHAVKKIEQFLEEEN